MAATLSPRHADRRPADAAMTPSPAAGRPAGPPAGMRPRRRTLAAECAARLVEVAPLVMRRVRARMRREMPDLTVPQFRALVYIEAHRGCALRELAGHLGNTPATASALVDRLVGRGWVSRATDAANRRQVRLALTARGADRLGAAANAARREIAEAIADAPLPVLLSARSGLGGLRERFAERGRPGGS